MEDSPAGSLEPIKERGLWTDGLGALELEQLNALASDIDKAVDQTVKAVARGKIKVGKLLLEARSMFREDQAFGRWRREKTMVQSKQHAHYLMKVAERFGDAPKLIDGVNYSVLQELLLAEQKDIEWIEKKVEAGEPIPKVAEVRERVNQTLGKGPGTSKRGKIPDSSIPKGVITHNPNAPLNHVVQLSLTLRIQEVVKRGIKGIEGDYLIMGMDPDPQCPCNHDVLSAARDWWLESTTDPNEQRAVEDSFRRIEEEHRNWDE